MIERYRHIDYRNEKARGSSTWDNFVKESAHLAALDQKIEDIAGMVEGIDKSTHPADIADLIRAMKGDKP